MYSEWINDDRTRRYRYFMHADYILEILEAPTSMGGWHIIGEAHCPLVCPWPK